jgi:hypothetical protein
MQNGIFLDTIRIEQRGFVFSKDNSALFVHNTKTSQIVKVDIRTNEIIPTKILLNKAFYNNSVFYPGYVFIDAAGSYRAFDLNTETEINLSKLNEIKNESNPISKKDQGYTLYSYKKWSYNNVTISSEGDLRYIYVHDFYDKKRFFLNYSQNINDEKTTKYKVSAITSTNYYGTFAYASISKHGKYFIFLDKEAKVLNYEIKDFTNFKTVSTFSAKPLHYAFKGDSTLILINADKSLAEILVKTGKPTAKAFETEIKYTAVQKRMLDSALTAQNQVVTLRSQKENELKAQREEKEKQEKEKLKKELAEKEQKQRLEALAKKEEVFYLISTNFYSSPLFLNDKNYDDVAVYFLKDNKDVLMYTKKDFAIGEASLAIAASKTVKNIKTKIDGENINMALFILKSCYMFPDYKGALKSNITGFLQPKVDSFMLVSKNVSAIQKEEYDFLNQYTNFNKSNPKSLNELNSINQNLTPLAYQYYAHFSLKNEIDSTKFPVLYTRIKKSAVNPYFNANLFALKKDLKPTIDPKATNKANPGDISSFNSDEANDSYTSAQLAFQKEAYAGVISSVNKYLSLEKKPVPMAYWMLGVSYYQLKDYKNASNALKNLNKAGDKYYIDLYHPNLDALIAYCAKPIGNAPVPMDKFSVFENLENEYNLEIKKLDEYSTSKEAVANMENIGLKFIENKDQKSYHKILLDISQYYYGTKQYIKSERFARKAIDPKNHSSKAHEQLITIWTAKKRFDKCKTYMDSLASVVKDTAKIANLYSMYYIEYGMDRVENDRLEAAVSNFIKSLSYDHENAFAHMMLGNTIYERKISYLQSNEKAKFHLKKSLELNPDLQFQYGNVYNGRDL